MKHPEFARDLKVGDFVNGRCSGWLEVQKIEKHSLSSLNNIHVVFTNGTHNVYSGGDRVDAIRR